MSWYIGLGRTSCENETWSSRRSSRPYGTIRVPDMDPPPSSALSLFILVTTIGDLEYGTAVCGTVVQYSYSNVL